MDIYNLKIVQFFKDLSNFSKFRKQMKNEERRADSKFTQLNLHRNWLGNMLYVQIDCTNKDYMNAYEDKRRMLATKLEPYVAYLSRELNWGDYLDTTISNFVDENNKETLSFGVVFIFRGYTMTLSNLLFFIIFNIALGAAGIWAIVHFLL